MPALPLERSVGYQIRRTHRLVQRALQVRIEPHRVSLGMWYFLRALWDEDGLTQRELSTRVGTMEPTTMAAIMLTQDECLSDSARPRAGAGVIAGRHHGRGSRNAITNVTRAGDAPRASGDFQRN